MRRLALTASVAMAIGLWLVLSARSVNADNCGDPSDCQTVPSNIATATGFAAGAAGIALAVAVTQERRKKTSWIEIVLRDEDGDPVPGEAYQIQLPDGSIEDGTLDDSGSARIDGLEEGSCMVCFPNIDASEWRLA